MQRQIKFRAWDREKKELLYPSEMAEKSIFVSPLGDVFVDWGNGDVQELPEFELMQFTGLLDKNGKEIYEGDVVKSYIGQGEVRFGNYMAGGQDYYASIAYGFFIQRGENEDDTETLGQCEIIGNKFENTELLAH